MNESTARAERYDVADAASPAYLWEVAEKPVSVRIPYTVIDRLEHEAVESFRSLSSRGSEIGGLLFGFAQAGTPAVVTIDDYVLIPCDYSRGPLYRLAEADLARFEQAMAGNGQVVGFFRSHTRKGLSLDSDDLALVDAKFREPHHIALLVRPFATKASTAGIFIREVSGIRSEASYLEFPFRSAALSGNSAAAAETDRGTAPARTLPLPIAPKVTARAQIVPIASRREIVPPVAPPAAEPPAEPEMPKPEVSKPELPKPEAAKPEPPKQAPKPEAAKPEPPKQAPKPEAAKPEPQKIATGKTPDTAEAASAQLNTKSSKLVWLAASGLVAALLVVALFVYPGWLHRARPSAPVDSSPLSLRVERSAGELLLTWNRDSAAIKSATHAVLSISDGDQHENVDMDLGQLRNGSIVYSPVTADVTFRMEVSGPDQMKTTSESVRVLRTRPSPMPEETQSAAPSPQGQAKPAAPANSAAQSSGGATAAAKPADAPEADAEEPAPAHLAEPVKPFNTESLAQRLRPTRATDIPTAPEVSDAPAVAVSGLNLNTMTPPPAPPRPASPAPVNRPVASAPAPAPKNAAPGGQIRQAQLVYRKNPEYPRLAQESGVKGTVELIATIGADGHVKNVSVLKGHPLLQRAAIDAVRQWVYKPTMLNGKPVESQTQIVLNFTNDR